MPKGAVYFITADDEFIASNRAREIFDAESKNVSDEMSMEILDCSAVKASDVSEACSRAISAASTVPLFGGKTVVWMRGVNFLGDNRQSKGAETDEALAKFVDFISRLSPENAVLIISASPVDRRKKLFKEIQKISICEDLQSKDPSESCLQLIGRESEKLGVRLGHGAAEALAATVANNPRMAVLELEKLAAYVNGERPVSEGDISEMVPIFGEGDFFDISNNFYSCNLEGVLSALHRFFFANKNASARPILTVLQKQNSLLIQIRSLMDSGELISSTSPQPRGAMEGASEKFGRYFEGAGDKSSYNIFSQNAWYAGSKLAPSAGRFHLKKLFDIQMSLARAFEELIMRPGADYQVLRDMFVRCLSKEF